MWYKKNICDKMGFGYGSKYQLLRMLGWHRNFFNSAVSFTAQTSDNIKWLDFKFHGPEDKELMNAEFLEENISQKWNNYWPTNSGINGLNWDAIGVIDNTYILIEAKAYTDECGSSTESGGGKSNEQALEIFYSFQDKYQLTRINWTAGKDIYQIANRLVFLDFLNTNGVKAKLVYVLFINGYEFNTTNGKSKSATSREQWESKFTELFIRMGIKSTHVEDMISFCYIDCNPKNTKK